MRSFFRKKRNETKKIFLTVKFLTHLFIQKVITIKSKKHTIDRITTFFVCNLFTYKICFGESIKTKTNPDNDRI